MIWDLALNYDRFRAAWQEALDASDMRAFLCPATETLDLSQMSRTHETHVLLVPGRDPTIEPFTVSASLSWTWDALLSARTATTEEDLLGELFGTAGRDQDTGQPWLRVDITLKAALPWASPLPLPGTVKWRRWATDVTERLTPLLPNGCTDRDGKQLVLSWLGAPEARAQCAPDGRLYLTEVELSAWQGINLPRHWDDPDREPDEEPDTQLAELIGRVWKALQAWERSVRHLQKG